MATVRTSRTGKAALRFRRVGPHPPGGPPTIDLEGHPRSCMGVVDMEAYERGDELFDK